MYRFFGPKPLVSVLIAALFSQLVLPAAYGQESGDLAARKAKYVQLRINTGDSRYASAKEEEIVDAILLSTYASAETKAVARKYKDDVLWSAIWLHSSWAIMALYWSAIFPFAIASNPTTSTSPTAGVGIGIAISILGGASIALSSIFSPRFPPTLVQSYNDDVRKALNLTEADVIGF